MIGGIANVVKNAVAPAILKGSLFESSTNDFRVREKKVEMGFLLSGEAVIDDDNIVSLYEPGIVNWRKRKRNHLPFWFFRSLLGKGCVPAIYGILLFYSGGI
jgi:hypothetical protein